MLVSLDDSRNFLENKIIEDTTDVFLIEDDTDDDEFIKHLIKLGDQVEALDPRFKDSTVVHDYLLEHLDDTYFYPNAIYPPLVPKSCNVCASHCKTQNDSTESVPPTKEEQPPSSKHPAAPSSKRPSDAPSSIIKRMLMITPITLQINDHCWVQTTCTTMTDLDASPSVDQPPANLDRPNDDSIIFDLN